MKCLTPAVSRRPQAPTPARAHTAIGGGRLQCFVRPRCAPEPGLARARLGPPACPAATPCTWLARPAMEAPAPSTRLTPPRRPARTTTHLAAPRIGARTRRDCPTCPAPPSAWQAPAHRPRSLGQGDGGRHQPHPGDVCLNGVSEDATARCPSTLRGPPRQGGRPHRDAVQVVPDIGIHHDALPVRDVTQRGPTARRPQGPRARARLLAPRGSDHGHGAGVAGGPDRRGTPGPRPRTTPQTPGGG